MIGHPRSATPITTSAWGTGGDTNLATGRLLCQRHHTLAHDHRYQTNTAPNGKIAFTRRT